MNPPLGPNIAPIPLLKLAKTGIPTTPIKTNAKFDKKAYNGDNISPLKKTPNKANEKEIPIILTDNIEEMQMGAVNKAAVVIFLTLLFISRYC